MKPIDVGDMNRYGELYQRTYKAPSTTGSVIHDTPIDVGPVWFSIHPAKSWEIERAKAIQAQCTHVIMIWLPIGVSVDTRNYIVFNSRAFNFTGVQNRDEKDECLVIYATEQVQ